MVQKLPIVKLYLPNFDEEVDKPKLYFADLRLKEYRSVDGSQPWIIKEYDVPIDMEEIIEMYEVEEGIAYGD